MKVINAHWDSRNLGVRCAEVEFENDEQLSSLDELDEAVRGYDYIVAKVPSTTPWILPALQRAGFAFVECSVNFRHDLVNIGNTETLELQRRMTHRLVVNDERREYLFGRISEGLFTTDRVYLDERFTHEQAAQRYVSWIKDELDRGAFLYEVLLDEKEVGFFAYKEIEPGVSYPFLIGLYPECRGRHLGPNLIAESLLLSRERGCRLSSTVVSSNNIAVIKCHELVGSYIHQIQYVFVKHR